MYKVYKLYKGYERKPPAGPQNTEHYIQGYKGYKVYKGYEGYKGRPTFSTENQTPFWGIYKVYRVYEGYETFSLKTRNFVEGYTRCTRYTKDTRATAKATDPQNTGPCIQG